MDVAPHPHIGLQTVTWLLEGEVVHDDSLGHESVLRPGGVNVMTSGGGIAHAVQEGVVVLGGSVRRSGTSDRRRNARTISIICGRASA